MPPVEPQNLRVAEGEDAAVGGHQPVAAAVGRRRHAHDRLVERDASRRAPELRAAEGEDAAVGGHQPVAAAWDRPRRRRWAWPAAPRACRRRRRRRRRSSRRPRRRRWRRSRWSRRARQRRTQRAPASRSAPVGAGRRARRRPGAPPGPGRPAARPLQRRSARHESAIIERTRDPGWRGPSEQAELAVAPAARGRRRSPGLAPCGAPVVGGPAR